MSDAPDASPPPPDDLDTAATHVPDEQRLLAAQRAKKRLRALIAGFVTALVIVLAVRGAKWWNDWNYLGKIAPSGGVYCFKRCAIDVPLFLQNDPRWGDDTLGWSNGSVGATGCAIASTAMVLGSYGVDVDPQRLNWYLTETGGFTDEGWLYWERAADYAPTVARHVYEDLPSYRLIDTNLWNHNPVIVRIRFRSGTTHFVVICGKDGFDYLIRDPGAGGKRGLYPLRELGSNIEALRFYEKLPASK